MAKDKPTLPQLNEALKGKRTNGEVYEALGYTKNPNSSVIKKVKNWYSEYNIDLGEAVKSNLKETRVCPVCETPFVVSKRERKRTCSHSCGNIFFSHLKNKPENFKNYRTICFYHHDKKCVVCGEENIVEVHHYDEDHNNNAPKNLVPLCPTHHQYMHSSYKRMVEEIVDFYVFTRYNDIV